VNVLAHSQVALDLGPVSTSYVLGAIAPDLATMARVRIDRERLPEPVAHGYRCHLATDSVFHAQPGFRAGLRAISHDVRVRGVDRWVAHAVGHIGWELMLDGTLLGTPAHAAFLDALDVGEQVLEALDADDQARWSRLLEWRGRAGPRYDDPAWIADRLVVILAASPRLRFGPEHVPVVADVLAAHQAGVEEAAPAVVAATAAATAELLRTERRV
jgi:hypothetical protein